MADNELILTVNKRLARALQLKHAQAQAVANELAWEAPPILTWNAWLARCHQILSMRAPQPTPVLLSGVQEQALWQNVIQRSEPGKILLRPRETSVQVAAAWELLHTHGLAFADIEADGDRDVEAFLLWARRFEFHCKQHDWLDRARLASWLAESLPHSPELLPNKIKLHGFDELTPQQQVLVKVMQRQGADVERVMAGTRAGTLEARALPDSAGEIQAAAAQARTWLEQNPNMRIGIVVPGLKTHRAALIRALESVLTPATRLASTAPRSPQFNISLGLPLTEWPLVADALTALQLMRGDLHWQQAGRLLRSPYFRGYAAEAGDRARMDVALRGCHKTRWDLSTLERAAEEEDARQWRSALAGSRALLPEGVAEPGVWAQRFGDWLKALGWCGDGNLSSAEQQARQAWADLLQGFATVGAVRAYLDLNSALTHLHDLAKQTVFQPQSTHAPIQVLGLLEATALEFDALWVMGLEARAWPLAPDPNAFLPYALQRRCQMPRASAALAAQFTQRLMEGFEAAADHIVLSYPRREGDQTLSPSPLLPADNTKQMDSRTPLWRPRAGLLEDFDDGEPAPVPDGPAPGGSWALTDQSACPFRAFAAHRLKADPLEAPQDHMDARSRGQLVHQVLEDLWKELKSQKQLMALSQDELEQTIGRVVENACRRAQAQPPKLGASFWRLERERSRALIHAWLEIEKQRQAFTVRAREAPIALKLAGLEFKMRMDRCDTLADGNVVVLDYKTGRPVKQAVWNSSRPKNPQLPGYALALRAQGKLLEGLAFAWLRAGDLGFTGLTEQDDVLPGVKPVAKWRDRPDGGDSLSALLDYWQVQLGALAEGFKAGKSDTDPKQNSECDWCNRQVLCRVRDIGKRGEIDE